MPTDNSIGDHRQLKTASATKPKSALMYLCVLGLWLLVAVLINPRLFRLLPVGSSLAPLTGLLLVIFIACLNLFWLFGSFYLMLGVFGLASHATRPRPPVLKEYPSVAILYTTMNDFQEEAALSCVNQNYPHFHVFLLDDSFDAISKAAVDAFARKHPTEVTVIRRNNRQGHKAGNLNHALRHHVKEFPYFAVVDADSVSPPSFLAGLLAYFQIGGFIGYVQGSHRPNPVQKTMFARDLALGIVATWTAYFGPRNRFGNVIFLGHGGIIRYDVWKEVGGFPEFVSEDLAFSTRAAQLGYHGYFAPDVISYEDFPRGFRELRRQQEKYVKGACEYLHTEVWPYLRSPIVRWYEKLDVLLSCSSLFVPVLLLIYMVTYCVAMPAFLCSWKPITLQLGHWSCSMPVLVPNGQFHSLWTWDFRIITFVSMFAPVLGSVALLAKYPLRGMKMLLLSAVPYLSLVVLSAVATLAYLFSHKAVFLVTGDRSGLHPRNVPQGFSPDSPLVIRLGVEDRTTRVIEYLLGTFLIVACVLTVNLTLLAFALSILFGPLLSRVNWESALLRPFLYVPSALIGAGLLLAGGNLLPAQGSFMCLFAFHF